MATRCTDRRLKQALPDHWYNFWDGRMQRYSLALLARGAWLLCQSTRHVHQRHIALLRSDLPFCLVAGQKDRSGPPRRKAR